MDEDLFTPDTIPPLEGKQLNDAFLILSEAAPHLSPEELALWARALPGVSKRTGSYPQVRGRHLRAYLKAGIDDPHRVAGFYRPTHKDKVRFEGPAQAIKYLKAIDDDSAADYWSLGFSTQEAKEWFDGGVNPSSASAFRALGFAPEQGIGWHNINVDPYNARWYEDKGESSRSVSELIDMGFNPDGPPWGIRTLRGVGLENEYLREWHKSGFSLEVPDGDARADSALALLVGYHLLGLSPERAREARGQTHPPARYHAGEGWFEGTRFICDPINNSD